MDDGHGSLQIVAFPWLAFGHLLPFLELSKSLAKRGHRVSFISTPRNLKRLPSVPSKIALLIDFVSFPLPQVNNLPPDAESNADLHPDQVQFLKKSFDGLQSSFLQFLEASPRKPDWIIIDFSHHWAPPIASKFKVRCAFFSIFNATILTFFGDLASDGEGSRTSPEELTMPPKWIPFSSNIAYRLHEALGLFGMHRGNASGITDAQRLSSVLRGCSLIATRSCSEFESIWLNLAEKMYNKPVIPVGLLPPSCGKDEEEKAETSHSDDNARILEWLSKQPPRNVIFVAFGSEAMLSAEQQRELALGLELSKTPFLWALRRPADGIAELLPEEGHGILATGWVPQLEVLSHASVGAFLTHCGWSSVIEGLQFGHPLIMLPLFADQPLIARRLEEEKVGVEVPRDDKDGSFTKEGVSGAIRSVVTEEEGKVFRNNAQKLQEVFANKDLHESYIDKLIQRLRNFN